MKRLVSAVCGAILGVALSTPAAATPAGKGVATEAERPKYLHGEAKLKRGQTTVDFMETAVGGQGHTPLSTRVGVGRADKNYDFVKLRLRWLPEMVQSTASLETQHLD